MKKYLHKHPLKLESGDTLQEVEIAYHTIGSLNASCTNVVWIFHALTGSSDVECWWQGLVGENELLNPNEYFIVCANMLGSAYGTSGPLSVDPVSEEPYFHSFPKITVRDMVSAHELLRLHLGIRKIHFGIGGSMGGQQLLEWSVSHPALFENICLIATNAKHSPWGIAFNETQRMAIENDSTWKNKEIRAGIRGMENARAIALLSYRHYEAYATSQTDESDVLCTDYKASQYQRYQGKKLANRFNAFSYFVLTKAMDSHNVGRNRGGISNALTTVTARALVIGIASDLLFPLSEQRLIAREIRNAQLVIIESTYGHDGFLVETKKLSEIIRNFLSKQKEMPVAYATSAKQII